MGVTIRLPWLLLLNYDLHTRWWGGALDTLAVADGATYAGGTINLSGFERIHIDSGTNGVPQSLSTKLNRTVIYFNTEAGTATITVSMATSEAIADIKSCV